MGGLRGGMRFPWRSGNRFELLIDGPAFFTRMIEAIESARHYVLLEMYLIESGAVADRFVDALVQAAQRGVQVRVLLDDFGGRGLGWKDRRRLSEGGATVVFYNALGWRKWLRNLFRNHRKLLVVDGEAAFVGGAGLTDAFDPRLEHDTRWRETMVDIRGPVVADWQDLFAVTWHDCTHRSLDLPESVSPSSPGGQRGRIVASEGLHRAEITRSVIDRVAGAHSRIWIATAYFVPSWRLRRALRHAALRGVDVRLLLPGPWTDHPGVRHAGRRFYSRLLRDGIRILEYQPRFLHAKTVLCDDWASIGSSNLDRWNLRWNLEANQEVDDAQFAQEVAAMFERDFQNSAEYDYAVWERRAWRERALEFIGGTLDRWQDRWLDRLHPGRKRPRP